MGDRRTVLRRRDPLPPGPPWHPMIQTAVWSRKAQWLMSQCAARYGETFTLRILHEDPWIVLSNPAHVKAVFTGDPHIFHAGEGNRVLLPVVGEHSVLLLDEGAHLEQRKLLLPSFHGQRMQRYGALMAEVAAAEIKRWPRGEPYRLRPRMQALTLEIILRTVFGLERGPRLDRLSAELRRLLDMLTSPRTLLLPILLGPERLAALGAFQRFLQRVDRPIYEEIAQRRGAPGLERREDILSLLLMARHEDGSPMSDRELRDELVTLLVAGHETTATALAWAIERLVHTPDKLDRLTSEVSAGETEYLDAVIAETLRLRPVISIVIRRLTQPVEIAGRVLPEGVAVAPSVYLVHRRPDVYPDPDRFIPERFLGSPPGTYTWIPFGGGTRRCLGGAFAQFEMRVVLSELVRRRTLSPASPRPERVFRRAVTETPRRDAEVVIS
ncbi:MAG TPA: cytochrome P450 [Solirubrobacteraceae bacterium]|nr:cytochrome P450 [Solirubrobacteraceae bacterium]